MRILSIESSCDESAAAYLDVHKGKVRRLEHVVASQAVHEQYGGVVPEVAAREHSATLPNVLAALADKVVGKPDGIALGKKVDAIAVTQGPGLVTSLRVGIDAARSLAAAWEKPLYGVNHMEGHIYSNWLTGGGFADAKDTDRSMFPALVLIVSGGHTELMLMKDHGKYRLLGSTRDDAAGETFDKAAKLLGLGYPGGPKLSKLALDGDPRAIAFPRPMLNDPGSEFSFSGLKTAVRHHVTAHPEAAKDPKLSADIAASVQAAIVDVLVTKTVRAAREHDVRTVFLAGGVAANKALRDGLAEAMASALPDVRYIQPQIAFCTDNAAMIAMAGYYNALRRKPDAWAAMRVKIGWEIGRTKK
jgi:N6-L-threonylcarbamoyladenine synthase